MLLPDFGYLNSNNPQVILITDEALAESHLAQNMIVLERLQPPPILLSPNISSTPATVVVVVFHSP
jgi:hypothetical protein